MLKSNPEDLDLYINASASKKWTLPCLFDASLWQLIRGNLNRHDISELSERIENGFEAAWSCGAEVDICDDKSLVVAERGAHAVNKTVRMVAVVLRLHVPQPIAHCDLLAGMRPLT